MFDLCFLKAEGVWELFVVAGILGPAAYVIGNLILFKGTATNEAVLAALIWTAEMLLTIYGPIRFNEGSKRGLFGSGETTTSADANGTR